MTTTTTRAAWERHPNIRGPAGLMLHIHDSFRRESEALLAECASSAPNRARIRNGFGELASVLHAHHHAEELLLFPRLARAGFGAAELESEHRRLLAAIEAVELALVTDAEATTVLRELDDLLRSHLDAEESVSIPYLLEHPWI